MNVDILSFVIIITVDYIQELRSGGQAPSNFRCGVWGEMRLYYHWEKKAHKWFVVGETTFLFI